MSLVPSCGGSGGGATNGRQELRLIAPSSDGAANSEHPRLVWEGLGAAAASYRVTAFADEAHGHAIETATSTEPALTLAASYDAGQRVYVRVEACDAAGLALAGADSRFHVVPLPDDVPRTTVPILDAARGGGGYTLFNIQDPLPPHQEQRVAVLLVVNAHGEAVWWRRFEPGFVTDARVLPNDHLLHVYAPNGGASRAFESTWDGKTIVWRSRDGVQVHHDVIPGPGGHYLYITAIVRDVFGVPFEGDGLELVDPATNEVLWSWDIFDHVPVTELSPVDLLLPGTTLQGQDWTHSNAVVWDERRGLVWLSVRNLDRMLAIEYPSGEVRAVIGTNGLGGAGVMDHQHAPELQEDGSFLYFDNGNQRGWSRVAGFAWDPVGGSVTPNFEWRDDAPFLDPALGDVDRLADGNLLVVSGVGGGALAKPARILELTPAGEKVWELNLVGEGRSLGYWIYRAERLSADQLPDEATPFD